MGRPFGTGHSGYHPPACTCVSCVARQSGYRQGRVVWRGRDVTPEPAGRERPFGQDWGRGASARRFPGLLSILTTVLVGAALAVLVVYPLLPGSAQADVLRVQRGMAELAPWIQSSR